MESLFFLILIFSSYATVFGRDFCQPNENCWPTFEDIANLRESLSNVNEDGECLQSFPTFTSKDEQGPLVYNKW